MNGNNKFGTAAPTGTTAVDGWLDNSDAVAYTAGVLSGFNIVPSATTLNVGVGGVAGTPDVAILADPNGRKIRVGASSTTPWVVALPAAPGTSGQTEIVAIVVAQDATAMSSIQNGTDIVGVYAVAGTASTSATAPTDAQIRAALPNGSTAYYAVVATIVVAYGATAVAPSAISAVYSALNAPGGANALGPTISTAAATIAIGSVTFHGVAGTQTTTGTTYSTGTGFDTVTPFPRYANINGRTAQLATIRVVGNNEVTQVANENTLNIDGSGNVTETFHGWTNNTSVGITKSTDNALYFQGYLDHVNANTSSSVIIDAGYDSFAWNSFDCTSSSARGTIHIGGAFNRHVQVTHVDMFRINTSGSVNGKFIFYGDYC